MSGKTSTSVSASATTATSTSQAQQQQQTKLKLQLEDALLTAKSVSFAKMSLDFSAIARIAAAIGNPKKCRVVKLDLRDNNLGDAGGCLIASSLASNRSIRSLSLRGIFITAATASALAVALTLNDTLCHLDLRSNRLTANVVESIITALNKKEGLHLHNLDLGDNRFERRPEIISRLLNDPNITLRTLNISAIIPVASESDTLAIALESALIKNSSLTSLIARGNYFTSTGISHIANALARRAYPLFLLDIAYNPLIGNAGLEYIATLLRNQSSLVCLYLENCGITERGALTLANELIHSSLLLLDLGLNDIGAEGAASLIRATSTICDLNLSAIFSTGDASTTVGKKSDIICTALSENKLIVNFKFAKNNIGQQGVLKFSTLLRNNNTLQSLSLESNRINGIGLQFLGDSLQTSSSSLKHLNLSFNRDICDQFALYELIEFSRGLQSLSIEETVSYAALPHILMAVEGNNIIKKLNITFSSSSPGSQLSDVTAPIVQKILDKLRNNRMEGQVAEPGEHMLYKAIGLTSMHHHFAVLGSGFSHDCCVYVAGRTCKTVYRLCSSILLCFMRDLEAFVWGTEQTQVSVTTSGQEPMGTPSVPLEWLTSPSPPATTSSS
ncbi:hypothetical protein Pelo_14405 [Pelomyxa schiedti]|nr:hypothetical protein Pelo_14405 [Pelomyxa schiedti]